MFLTKYLFSRSFFFARPAIHPLLSPLPPPSFATFREKMENKTKKRNKDEFKKEIEYLASKSTYNLIDFKQRVHDGLAKIKKGFISRWMTGNEQSEASLNLHKNILNALSDEELLDELKITSDVKKEVASVAQTTVTDINTMLFSYRFMKNMHSYLKKLKDRGEALPENEEEIAYLMRRDRPTTRTQNLDEKKKYKNFSKKNLKRRIKWGPRKRM